MGGSSGGGGSSGKVDYPDYMKTFHNDMLNNTGADTFESSVVDACNAALGASPFATMAAYVPDTMITNMESALTAFSSYITGLSTYTTYANLINEAATIHTNTLANSTYLNASITALSNQLASDVNTYLLPAFNAGMRDINAVYTSSFGTGGAMILRKAAADAAKYGADLYSDVYFKGRLQFVMSMGEMIVKTEVGTQEALAKLIIDAKKIIVIMKKEQAEEDKDIDEKNAKWDLEVFKYAGNALASIGGGTSSTGSTPSKTQSALSGALAGASMGAAVGGPMGAGIGAAVGGIAGLLM
jgi:ribosomal protein L30E